jgi:octaprenyl-diphosphate synthase
MGQTRIGEQAARGQIVILVDQNAPGKHAERAVHDAHVIVEHEMVDIGAVQQRAHSGHQHHIIGPHEFTQGPISRSSPVGPFVALAASHGSFYGALKFIRRPDVAVIVPFESHSTPSIDRLVELVAPDMERVNSTILSRTGSEVTMIPEVANHLISSGGKRLRPMLTLAMANLTGYAGDGHIKLAAAVEFMHTATLLHDDVVDESELRRGKLSARMLWGNEASVLVGDFLLGQAFRMMVEVGSLRALDILSSAAATIAEGEVMQLAAAKNTATTEDEYLAVIRGKTAELFAAACEVGPVIANRPKAEQTACRSVGMNLGIAFQLVDDVLDYGGKAAKLGKNVGDDFREGKITLPVVLAFRRGNDVERAFWIRTLEKGEIAEGDLDHAIGLMTKHRALEDTMSRAQHYGAMAVDALALFPQSPMKTALEQVVAFCLARSH